VSVFWPSNAERDVIGYNVYRTDGEASASSQWTRVTSSVTTRTTYRDERVSVGSRYSYRITAVDRYGNESTPSAVVAESVSP
jgi:fibronectin type 3 domain-containing protein